MKRFVLYFVAPGLVLLLGAAVAHGQAMPVENHYKVYGEVALGIGGYTVTLTDQFRSFTHDVFNYPSIANPVEKIHDGVAYPMVDPFAHQMWWTLQGGPGMDVQRRVYYRDQFGPTRSLEVGRPVYLVTPALKNVPSPPPPLPNRNHYLCYETIGASPINVPVTLVDQFGTANVILLRPKFFCNPVNKFRHSPPTNYPIVDPTAHLVCYAYDRIFSNHDVVMFDQFGQFFMPVYFSDCLCVPALKENVVSTQSTTWGRIKALYR
jgi:hypothetical protein